MHIAATVQAVLAARIDRLPTKEKRLLQTAGVVGPEVPFARLQVIAEVPDATLHRGLVYLQAAECLYETRLFPETDYTFKHALTYPACTIRCWKQRGERQAIMGSLATAPAGPSRSGGGQVGVVRMRGVPTVPLTVVSEHCQLPCYSV